MAPTRNWIGGGRRINEVKMKYIYVSVFVALVLAGCSKAATEAYKAGCIAGISEVISSQGLTPNDEAISAFCDKSAKDRK